MSEFFNHEGH